ncbi:META domain-containing protein [Taibaiella koreensis]|uniref:META domain-containing protein n=1 Tax=Taibaiella koreensis TaxID=1268548 RepID=UPI000E59B5A9|nr:META domain-containing protein [Taibaiella koreensis]
MKPILLLLAGTLLLSAGCATFKGSRPSKETSTPLAVLDGSWTLDLLATPVAALDSLYPGRKPELTFDTRNKRFSGYTGCNSLNGPLVSSDHTISFRGDIALTLMACRGEGEATFLQQLKRINKYDVSSDNRTLTLIQGDIALMRFHRKQGEKGR